MRTQKASRLFANWNLQNSMDWIFRVIILLVIVIILSSLSENFFTFSNIINVLRQASILMILSLGVTCVLLTGGIDLSVGGVMAFVGCLVAQLLVQKLAIPIAILIGLIVGAIMGGINGFLVGTIGLPAFVATYGMMWIAEGFARILMQGRIIFGLPKKFLWFGAGYIWKIPVPIIFMLVLAILFYYFLRKTVHGRNIFALGANKNAALFSGIKTNLTTIMVYAISGITAAIAGIIMTARMDAAEAGMGAQFSTMAVASVVMGGTSLRGGEGGVVGSLIGALILYLIVNGLNLMGVSSLAHSLVNGLVILTAVYFDIFLKKKVV